MRLNFTSGSVFNGLALVGTGAAIMWPEQRWIGLVLIGTGIAALVFDAHFERGHLEIGGTHSLGRRLLGIWPQLLIGISALGLLVGLVAYFQGWAATPPPTPAPKPAVAKLEVPMGTVAFVQFVPAVNIPPSLKTADVQLRVELENSSDTLLTYKIKDLYGIVNGKTVPNPAKPAMLSSGGYIYPHKHIYLLYQRIDGVDISNKTVAGTFRYLIEYSPEPNGATRVTGKTITFSQVIPVGPNPVGTTGGVPTIVNLSDEIER